MPAAPRPPDGPGGIDNPTDPRVPSPDVSLRQSSYGFTSRVFPLDLGQEDNAHYMVININVPVKGLGPGAGGLDSPQNTNLDTGNVSVLNGFENLSIVDKLRFGKSAYSGGAFHQNFNRFVK